MTQRTNTYVTYNYSGDTQELEIPFEYLKRSFVHVYLMGEGVSNEELNVNVDFKFVSKTTISLLRSYQPSEGFNKILIRRLTDASKRIVSFQDGSILNAKELNISQIQALHVAEEARDLGSYTIGLTQNNELDASHRKIINVENPLPLNDTDAANIKTVKALLDIQANSPALASSSIEMLRQTEPKLDRQVMNVKSYYGDSQSGGGLFFYDASDKESRDNAGTVIVTPLGARWKRLSTKVYPEDFGAKGDGVTDDETPINKLFEFARTNNVEVEFKGSTYKVTKPINISGVSFKGVLKGYLNENGTIIKGNGDHIILEQVGVNRKDITYEISNVRIINGTVGYISKYGVNVVLNNIFIENCVNGFRLGDSSTVGNLWCTLNNCVAKVSGIALELQGKTMNNANLFNTCYFKGGTTSVKIQAGGIGACSNKFLNTEITGDQYGVTLGTNKNTTFDGCYFETKGPAILIQGYTTSLYLNTCLYGSLKTSNPTGKTSFIYHESGAATLTVDSGTVYLADQDTQQNLSLLESAIPSSMVLNMLNPPTKAFSDVKGFKLFKGEIPLGGSLSLSEDFKPTITTSGFQLGDGSLTGSYVLSGKICNVNLYLKVGGTTNLGTGAITFRLPFKAVHGPNIGNCIATDVSTYKVYQGAAHLNKSSSLCVFYFSTTKEAASNTPFTWASSDTLKASISYATA